MNIIELEEFRDMIDCYFNQEFGEIYPNLGMTANGVIEDHPTTDLVAIVQQTNLILENTGNEKNLENFLDETFHISITPQSPGIDMNTYTELLEYIRDKIKNHLESKGISLF